MAPVCHLVHKILNFGRWIFVIVLVYFSIQNFIKSTDSSLKSGDITIFKMVVITHLGISKCLNIFTFDRHYCRILHPHTKFREIQLTMLPSYGRYFPIWRPSHIKFKNLNFGQMILIIVAIRFSQYQISSQSDHFSLRYHDIRFLY